MEGENVSTSQAKHLEIKSLGSCWIAPSDTEAPGSQASDVGDGISIAESASLDGEVHLFSIELFNWASGSHCVPAGSRPPFCIWFTGM